MFDDPLVVATYALVIATVLLVVAGAIPAVTNILESRRTKAGRAARVVPDMNILQSRLHGQARQMAARNSMTLDQLDEVISEMEGNLRYITKIINGSYDVSLQFANEMYLVRHFITAAADDVRFLAREEEKASGKKSIHELVMHGHAHHHTPGSLTAEGRISKAAASLIAADRSIRAGEELLPKGVRTVDGQSFWDRYSKAVSERTNQAEKSLVDWRRPGRRS